MGREGGTEFGFLCFFGNHVLTEVIEKFPSDLRREREGSRQACWEVCYIKVNMGLMLRAGIERHLQSDLRSPVLTRAEEGVQLAGENTRPYRPPTAWREIKPTFFSQKL